MSKIHLAKGSTQPPKVEGKLRLYSMEFCPFAERPRLILLAKNLPHDIVNVHLKNKPDWIFDLHPEGKVPALDTGSEVVIESLDVCDYLDEKYPEPPLYPQDKERREQDKQLIKEFDELIVFYYKAVYNENGDSYEKHLQNLLPRVQKLEDELKKRGTYFGGDKPNMVDYMIWPWGERAALIPMAFQEKLPDENAFPALYSWCKAMHSQKAVQQTVTSAERLFKLQQQYLQGPDAVDYESI
ncbi:hypothetical protein ILUMI_11245 [Ignelater luminosus]|uniref:Uncharacterized protein n=1 Tax=Ignelater luminosus TaxID=2038154 RepID=A0A8K0CWA5_IGNLU|nr:hypothetical protein ILUMI_11245 [Ignelater luminosus]